MLPRYIYHSFLAVVVAIVCPASATQAGDHSAKSVRPNVIVMMADDLGYGDLGCYGGKVLKTPVLDKMAREGVRLTSFYAGCTVCTPSRMALLTGAYPARLGWRGGVVGYGVKPVNGLAPEALTMAEVFKSAGYATALIGKWHLGDAPSMLPMSQGFDTTYFITKSNNQTKKLFRGRQKIADPFENRRLTEQFVDESIKFIRSHREQPFFLYVPFTAPHFPAQSHSEWKGKSKLGAYGDVVEELDSRIGQILGTLKECQLDDKTLVVFLSDNGPEPGQRKWARATPYRGLKWSALEGGNRVPCIIRWPSVVPGGRTSNDLTAAIDLLPTLTRAAGLKLSKAKPARPKLDGVDVWDTILGSTEKGSRTHARKDLLIWHGWGIPQAIRVGDWKLYLDQVKEIAGSDKRPVLINLAEDPEEKNDLSRTHPQRVRLMKALALQRLADIKSHAVPLGGPADNSKPRKKPARWLQ